MRYRTKILVGLTDLCPTEEHIDVVELDFYPFNVFNPEGKVSHIMSERDLRIWANQNYEIWTIKEVG